MAQILYQIAPKLVFTGDIGVRVNAHGLIELMICQNGQPIAAAPIFSLGPLDAVALIEQLMGRLDHLCDLMNDANIEETPEQADGTKPPKLH